MRRARGGCGCALAGLAIVIVVIGFWLNRGSSPPLTSATQPKIFGEVVAKLRAYHHDYETVIECPSPFFVGIAFFGSRNDAHPPLFFGDPNVLQEAWQFSYNPAADHRFPLAGLRGLEPFSFRGGGPSERTAVDGIRIEQPFHKTRTVHWTTRESLFGMLPIRFVRREALLEDGIIQVYSYDTSRLGRKVLILEQSYKEMNTIEVDKKVYSIKNGEYLLYWSFPYTERDEQGKEHYLWYLIRMPQPPGGPYTPREAELYAQEEAFKIERKKYEEEITKELLERLQKEQDAASTPTGPARDASAQAPGQPLQRPPSR